MKKIIASITIFGLLLSTGAHAQEGCCPPEPKVYYDETPDCFNKGKFVGKDSDDFLKSVRRAQQRNWAVAFGSAAVGVLTLVLVGVNHKNEKDSHHKHNVKSPS